MLSSGFLLSVMCTSFGRGDGEDRDFPNEVGIAERGESGRNEAA